MYFSLSQLHWSSQIHSSNIRSRVKNVSHLLVSLCVFMAGSGLGVRVQGRDYLACLPSGALRVLVFVQD